MKRVLDVGNCGFDHGSICRLLEANWNVQVDQARTFSELKNAIEAADYDLLIVNRILDGDGTAGLEAMSKIQTGSDKPRVPFVLLTNFPEVQQEAQQAGAVASFGKRDLGSPDTHGTLNSILSESVTTTPQSDAE